MDKLCMINLNIKIKKINGIPRKCYYIDYVEYDAERVVESSTDKTKLVESLKSKKLNKSGDDNNEYLSSKYISD